MSLKQLNIILALLAVLLLSYNQWNTYHLYSTLTELDVSSISQINLIQPGNKIQLQRNDQGWFNVKTGNQVQTAFIEKVFATTRLNVHREFKPSENNLRSFGLSTEDTVIMLNDKKFVIGIHEPVTQQRYILYNNKISLVTDHFLTLLQTTEEQITQ